MASFSDELMAEVVRTQVRLQACRARLTARTDDEALHDLRIALRKLRSLLRPLRGLPGVEVLEQATKALGEMSGPLRDREVLLAELNHWEHDEAIRWRRLELDKGYQRVLRGAPLQQLQTILVAWPALWRTAERNRLLPPLGPRTRKQLVRERHRLAEALRDPDHDPHRLRLLIKRVRYGAQAYPKHAGIPNNAAKALQRAQTSLGEWHDRWQWLERAKVEPDLRLCCAAWQVPLATAEQQAERALVRLQRVLPR
jgi:CHAD domain-containing protein